MKLTLQAPVVGCLASLLALLGCAPVDEPGRDTGKVRLPSVIDDRRTQLLQDQYEKLLPANDPDNPNQLAIAQAYASYLTGNIGQGDAFITDLSANGFPDFGGKYNGWDGHFMLPLFMRMFVIDSQIREAQSEDIQSQFEQMIYEYVAFDCDYATAVSDSWTPFGTENLTVLRKSACLLGSYWLSNSSAFANTLIQDRLPGEHYDAWKIHMASWLREHAKAGLLDEISSPQYGKYTIASIYNLRDFPGDLQIRQLATSYLQLFWHDQAHDFNKSTGVQGAAGSRMYQTRYGVDPGTPYYQDPTQNWVTRWTYLYDWHDFDPGSKPHPAILVAVDSSFRPLLMSRKLATMDGKAIEYASRRPGMLDAVEGESHRIRRDISTNDAFTMGAVTYHPAFQTRGSAAECIWYSVTANSERQDRILLTGMGTEKGTGLYADKWALNGAAYRDVIIAARRKIADNLVGMKIYLSEGAMRDNFEKTAADEWMFTRSGDAYIAMRIPEPGLDFKLENGQVSTIRMNTGEDTYVPIVIQAAQAKDFVDFQDFKTRVANLPYTFDGETVTFQSLRNHTYEMSRQQSVETLPKIDGVTRVVSPSYVYESPYLFMDSGTGEALLSGPGGFSKTLNF